MNNAFIVVAYYTADTFYEEYAKTFIQSLKQYKILHYVKRIENLGSWFKNTGYKATFLKEMLIKFPDKNIVYVDIDAVFHAYPKLFNELNCNIAVYTLDRKRCYKKKQKGMELLSGTIFLRNNKEVFNIVEEWERECQKHPSIFDQKSLEKVLTGNFERLPGEYCKIYDRMEWIKNPIIVHHQASRRARKNKWKLK